MTEPMTPESVIELARKRWKCEAYVANRFFGEDDRKGDWALYLWNEISTPWSPARWMFQNSAPTLEALATKIGEVR